LRLKWDLPIGNLTSITALEKSQSLENYSSVAANYHFLTSGNQSVIRDAEQEKTFSQEFRYASPKWTLGDFLLGTYYSNQDGHRQLTTTGLAAQTGAVAASTQAGQEAHTMSYGVFGDGTVHLPYQFDLTGGLRYTYDNDIAGLDYTDHISPKNNFNVTGAQTTAGEFTPRVVLSWHPQPNVMGYASVTRGFTSGGFNSDASSARAFNQAFAPEKVTNYELGFKTQWLENRLRVNGAIYEMKYVDKQELVFNSTNGILDIVNAGRATVKGAELEVAYKPVSWLNTSVTYGLIDGRYDQFQIGTLNYTGHALANAPRTSISLASDVNLPLLNTDYRFIGSGNFSWQSQTGSNTGSPLLVNDAYGLLNFSLGVESPDGKYRLVAWIKNATNKEYTLTHTTQVVNGEYLGAPRMFGVTLTGHY
jgi:iron complex outermembrane recepter protein